MNRLTSFRINLKRLLFIYFHLFIFSSGSKKEKDSRKRERSASSAKLDKFEIPAAKMARATGADPSRESKFLEDSFKKKERR